MNNTTHIQPPKSQVIQAVPILPGDISSSYIYLLVYIAALTTLTAIILIYWFFVECQTGKLIAQKIVDGEYCGSNLPNNTNSSDIYELTDKDRVSAEHVVNYLNCSRNNGSN